MTTYREYYAACCAGFPRGDDSPRLYELGVQVQVPGQARPHDLFVLDQAYVDAVTALGTEMDTRIRDGRGRYRNRDPRAAEMAIQLDDFWGMASLEWLASIVVPCAERKILGCHGLVNQVNLIRSRPASAAPASSWLWHYDNKPDEAFKILIYLTDVDGESGAFEYLRRPATGEVIRIGSSRSSSESIGTPRWPQSRVPASAIEEYRALGFEPFRVAGPRGTLVAFDNNCVHRATIPRHRHRDAVILNVRPCHERVRPFISKRHTGSWSFNAKRWIPEVLEIPANP